MVGLDSVSVAVWERTKCEIRETPLQLHLIVSHLLDSHRYFKLLFSIIHHLVLSLTNPSDSCVKGGIITARLLGRNLLRKSVDLKRLSSGNRCARAVGGTLHVSMRMHTFPCETISKAGVHYQHNGPADGCSCHIRLSALGHHRKGPCSEGGQGSVTGQSRAAGGCMSCSLDHTGNFQITISIFIPL